MPSVLIFADTLRSPAMRHEVPLVVPDAFLYAEHEGGRHVVSVAYEIDRVDGLGLGIVARPYEEFGYDDLIGQGLSRPEAELDVVAEACRRLGIKGASVPPEFPVELADHLRAQGIDLTVDRELFEGRRRVKNEHELAGIRRAQAGTQAAMAAACELLRKATAVNGEVVLDGDPLTCERLKAEVQRVFGERNLTADEFVVSHGPQTAVGHDMGSGPIGPGEPIVLDLFPRDRESGCYADMTRTYVVGEPSDELVEYHRLCLEALERSVEAIRPGVPGRDIHKLACDVIASGGYPTQLSKEPGQVLMDGFYHSLGHGVGLEVHEAPSLGRAPGVLVAGDVVSVEPGIYRQGYGGVRLEDIVLVTDDGAENLTEFPYDLEP